MSLHFDGPLAGAMKTHRDLQSQSDVPCTSALRLVMLQLKLATWKFPASLHGTGELDFQCALAVSVRISCAS